MQLFHYHLVTSKVRDVESRYIAKLGFQLVARYGRIGDEQTHYEPGVPWEELERLGFRLRLTELERGAVNVVVQPGQWELPRIDHVGFALDEDEFLEVMERAQRLELRVQEYPGRRTFVATGVGYRVEIHPPREWIDELLAEGQTMRLAGAAAESRGSRRAVLGARTTPRRGPGRAQRPGRRCLHPVRAGRPAGTAAARRRIVLLIDRQAS